MIKKVPIKINSSVIMFVLLLTASFITNTAEALPLTPRDIDDKLFEAIQWYGNDQIEDLLQRGANPDAESLENVNSIKAGETVWLFALKRSSPNTIALLKRYRTVSNPLSLKLQARAFAEAMATTQASNPNYSQERMQLLIDNGLNVNAIDLEDLTNQAHSASDGLSPLMMAVEKDRADWVKFLLSQGADVNLKTRTGENVLFFARSDAIARLLLEAGAEAGAVGEYGRTLLQEAVLEGRAEVVSALLEKGNLKQLKADEALLVACRVMIQTTNQNAAHNSSQIIKMLLDHGIDPNLVVEKEGWKDTPLLAAVHANNAAGVKLLLEAGADPLKVRNGDGSLLELAVQQDDPEITRLLLPRYLPLSNEDKESLSRVILQYGKPKVFSVLEEHGLKIIETKNDPISVAAVEGLIKAVNEDKIEMAAELLNQGVDINASGYNHTPLTAAVYYGNKRMVEFLVEKGADVNRADKNGRTPLGSAVAKANREIYDYLKLKKVALVSSDPAHPYLHLAVYGVFHSGFSKEYDGAVDIMEDLIRLGNLVDQIDKEGKTPLWQLTTQRPMGAEAEVSFVKAAELLLQNGAVVNWVPAQCKDVPNKPRELVEVRDQGVFSEPVSSHRISIIDPQAIMDYLCRTPLINAVAAGNKAVARVLIESGANVNWASPANGMTPLMHAAFNGDPQIVTMLLDHGADPRLREDQNKTAADIARERGNTKALVILEKAMQEVLK